MTEQSADPSADQAGIVDGVNVDELAAAAAGCPGVAGLYAGRFGEIGSYLPGRRVAGVEVGRDAVTIQVRSRWNVTASDLLRQISTVTAGRTGGRSLRVVMADIEDPAEPWSASPVVEQSSADQNQTTPLPPSPERPALPRPGSAPPSSR